MTQDFPRSNFREDVKHPNRQTPAGALLLGSRHELQRGAQDAVTGLTASNQAGDKELSGGDLVLLESAAHTPKQALRQQHYEVNHPPILSSGGMQGYWISINTTSYPAIREAIDAHDHALAMSLIQAFGEGSVRQDPDLLALEAHTHFIKKDVDEAAVRELLHALETLADAKPPAQDHAAIIWARLHLHHDNHQEAHRHLDALFARKPDGKLRALGVRIRLVTLYLSGDHDELERRWDELSVPALENVVLRANIALRLRWEERFLSELDGSAGVSALNQTRALACNRKLEIYRAVFDANHECLSYSAHFVQFKKGVSRARVLEHIHTFEEMIRSLRDERGVFLDEHILLLETNINFLSLIAENEAVLECSKRLLDVWGEHPEALFQLAFDAYFHGDIVEAQHYIDRFKTRDSERRKQMRHIQFLTRVEKLKQDDPEALEAFIEGWLEAARVDPERSFQSDPVLWDLMDSALLGASGQTLPDECFCLEVELAAMGELHILAQVTHLFRQAQGARAFERVETWMDSQDRIGGGVVMMAVLFADHRMHKQASVLYQRWCEGREYIPPHYIIKWASSRSFLGDQEGALALLDSKHLGEEEDLLEEDRLELHRVRTRIAYNSHDWRKTTLSLSLLRGLGAPVPAGYEVAGAHAYCEVGEREEAIQAITRAEHAVEEQGGWRVWSEQCLTLASLEAHLGRFEACLEKCWRASFVLEENIASLGKLCATYHLAFMKSGRTQRRRPDTFPAETGEWVVICTPEKRESPLLVETRAYLLSLKNDAFSKGIDLITLIELGVTPRTSVSPGMRVHIKNAPWLMLGLVDRHAWRLQSLRHSLIERLRASSHGKPKKHFPRTEVELQLGQKKQQLASDIANYGNTPFTLAKNMGWSEPRALLWFLTQRARSDARVWTIGNTQSDINERFIVFYRRKPSTYVLSATSAILIEYADAWTLLEEGDCELCMSRESLRSIEEALLSPTALGHVGLLTRLLHHIRTSDQVRIVDVGIFIEGDTPVEHAANMELCCRTDAVLIDDGGSPVFSSEDASDILYLPSLTLTPGPKDDHISNLRGGQLQTLMWRSGFEPAVWSRAALAELLIDVDGAFESSIYAMAHYFCSQPGKQNENLSSLAHLFAYLVRAAVYAPDVKVRRELAERADHFMRFLHNTRYPNAFWGARIERLRRADPGFARVRRQSIRLVLEEHMMKHHEGRFFALAMEVIVRAFAPFEELHLREERQGMRGQDKEMPEDTAPKLPFVHHLDRPNRNASCPCGSGLKYKRCCWMSGQWRSGSGASRVRTDIWDVWLERKRARVSYRKRLGTSLVFGSNFPDNGVAKDHFTKRWEAAGDLHYKSHAVTGWGSHREDQTPGVLARNPELLDLFTGGVGSPLLAVYLNTLTFEELVKLTLTFCDETSLDRALGHHPPEPRLRQILLLASFEEREVFASVKALVDSRRRGSDPLGRFTIMLPKIEGEDPPISPERRRLFKGKEVDA